MFPILISVSLAPVSYFFWASAALPAAAATARLRSTVAKRRRVGLGISQNSLGFSWASRDARLVVSRLVVSSGRIDTAENNVRKKKPPAAVSQGGMTCLVIEQPAAEAAQPPTSA